MLKYLFFLFIIPCIYCQNNLDKINLINNEIYKIDITNNKIISTDIKFIDSIQLTIERYNNGKIDVMNRFTNSNTDLKLKIYHDKKRCFKYARFEEINPKKQFSKTDKHTTTIIKNEEGNFNIIEASTTVHIDMLYPKDVSLKEFLGYNLNLTDEFLSRYLKIVLEKIK